MYNRIKHALKCSFKAHQNEMRDDGRPYITHPVAVYSILKKADCSDICLISGLLHDSIESNSLTKDQIEIMYGKQIAYMVNALTKTKGVDYFRQLEQSCDIDPYIIIVKLADRLHNLQTIDVFDKNRKERYIKETINELLPLAYKILKKNINNNDLHDSALIIFNEIQEILYKYV